MDEVLRSTESNSLAPTNNSGLFAIGGAGSFDDEFFGGRIDEVRISNVALYTSTFTPPSTPLTSSASTVGLWHLNEGSGQTIADSSGNGRDGTLGTTSSADSADPTWSTDTPVSGFRGGHVLARLVPPVQGAALLDVNALPALQTGGELTTRTITYTYDALHRLTGTAYSDGTEFAYEYDSVGNVLTRTQTIAAVESVTSYDYDTANQLETAQTSGQSTVWYYTYDNNGSLTKITPNGTAPANGARRYTYNAIR